MRHFLVYAFTYLLFGMVICALVARRYKRRYGPIQFKSNRTHCIGCGRKMNWLRRVFRDDGYHAFKCRKAHVLQINGLALRRLQAEHERIGESVKTHDGSFWIEPIAIQEPPVGKGIPYKGDNSRPVIPGLGRKR